MKIPLRRSLVTETYLVLRDIIESGEWQHTLPGERSLCSRFQISRPTLRKALSQLEKDGLLATSKGQRRRIQVPAKPLARRRTNFKIGFLSPVSPRQWEGHTHLKVAEIEYLIHQRQIEFSIVIRPGCYSHSPDKALRNVIQETQADSWIVQHTNREMQAFLEKERIRAVVTGTRHRGIQLPFVDLDNEAVCRHAVGLLAAKGRRHIHYLTNKSDYAGDLLSEAGFLKALESLPEVKGRIVRHNGTRDAIHQKLKSMLSSRQRPDGLIVDKASHAFAVHSFLTSHHVDIPGEIALLCRTDSNNLDALTPSVARYSRNTPELAKRTAELAIRLADGQPPDPKGVLIIPDLIPGESL